MSVEKSAEQDHINKTFDLELDFENYTVPEERASAIREEIARIKSKTWLSTMGEWVETQGEDYYPFGQQTELGETPQKRIGWEAGHALEKLELIYDGAEVEVRVDGKKFLSLQRLPKGDELLLSHYNPDLAAAFELLESELHEQLKVFLKAKAEKQKAFQERFKKAP